MADLVCVWLRTEGKALRSCGWKPLSLDTPKPGSLHLGDIHTWRPDNSLLCQGVGELGVGTVLCIVGCLAASLGFTR